MIFFLILTHMLMLLLNYFLQVCFTSVKIQIIKGWYTTWSAALVICMSSWSVSHLGKGILWYGSALTSLPVHKPVRHFHGWLLMWEGTVYRGRATCKQVVLRGMRKQVEHAMQGRASQSAAFFLCLCFSSCPEFPSWWNITRTWKLKHFPPWRAFSYGVLSQKHKP